MDAESPLYPAVAHTQQPAKAGTDDWIGRMRTDYEKQIAALTAENAALVQKLAAAENDNDRLSQMARSGHEMMAERDAASVKYTHDTMTLTEKVRELERIAFDTNAGHEAQVKYLTDRLNTIIPSRDAMAISLDAAIKDREKLIEEIGMQKSQRDKFRYERDALKKERDAIDEKWVMLMSAIGGHLSTTDLAIKALGKEMDERDRYKDALVEIVGLYDGATNAIAAKALSGK